MKAISLIFISLAVIATVNATCADANATAGQGGTCFCNAGYYGTSTDVSSGGSCKKCPTGATSPASTTSGTLKSSCTCIDTNAIPDITYTLCLCNDNYYGTPTSSGASGCTPCPTGSKSFAGSTTVTQCLCGDFNSVINDAKTACQCKANYYGTPTSSGPSGCTKCPTDTTSTIGTTALSSCACPDTNASLNTANPPVCQCKANFYGSPTSSGASGCTACPNGQIAPAGSSTNVCKVASTSSTYILPIVSLLFSLVMLI
ncbi:immobilization antigen (macronuclear) [Tetrahymena thermophila SB210]|uniref:Immobilization antigen n=1 Tax=Tetrahymena thermophila (strain SB210) TaxID=312017 RepID=Q232H0_TETTS|nr:immobilization antigen [Tetrahymena thermophila SB210]EAR91442.1 immobilization antigen [Tetrahymena thermophila SB210]|eukprot:XP_001011687.1 immobilization antigen [Tetrahymena thermophila SB210]